MTARDGKFVYHRQRCGSLVSKCQPGLKCGWLDTPSRWILRLPSKSQAAATTTCFVAEAIQYISIYIDSIYRIWHRRSRTEDGCTRRDVCFDMSTRRRHHHCATSVWQPTTSRSLCATSWWLDQTIVCVWHHHEDGQNVRAKCDCVYSRDIAKCPLWWRTIKNNKHTSRSYVFINTADRILKKTRARTETGRLNG